jgi:tetratricopeptide (TPR) repeat protein
MDEQVVVTDENKSQKDLGSTFTSDLPDGKVKTSTQIVLGAILAVIGIVAFAPMFSPMIVRQFPPVGNPIRTMSAPSTGRNRTPTLASDPRNRDIFYSQGHQKAYAGRYKEAIEALTKVIDSNGRRIDALFQRGKCYLAIKRYDLALRDFNNAIAINPYDRDLYVLRAQTHQRMGNDQLAKDDYSKADKCEWHGSNISAPAASLRSPPPR